MALEFLPEHPIRHEGTWAVT